MLKGNLSAFGLGEIFQSLAINKRTGTLTITAPDTAPRFIYFEEGDIRFFSHGSPKTPRIGEILVRSGRLNKEHLEAALEEAKSTHQVLGQVLRERGYISEDDIRHALAMKISEELYELFTATEGEFEFLMDECPEELFDVVQKSVRVRLSTNAVIMEGLRRIDEWGVIRSKIKTENEIYTPTGAAPPRDSHSPVEEALGLIDGTSPVTELTDRYAGPKFDLLKSIYDLLEAAAIRPLTVSELVRMADDAKKARNLPAAAAFLRFATERVPEESSLHIALGDVLTKFFQEKEAERAYLKALRLAFDHGDWDSAATIAEKFPPNADIDARDLQMLLHTFIELKLTKKALWAGQQLATTLQKEGETQKAAEVLDSLVELDPSDLNLRIQIATLFQQVGEATRATDCYEQVAEELEKQKKIKDQIKILRIMAELNPKRTEIKQKIATLTALQEKLERQRKRRLTFAGVGVIGLMIFTVVPLIYELKAREIFSHGYRMEQISITTGDFTKARRIYEELLKNYSLSTKAHESRLALQRISSIERSYLDTLKSRDDERKKEEESKRRALEESIATALAKASEAEGAGNFQEAHVLYRRAMELGKRSRKVRTVLLPVLIESDPAGATISINGEELGRTPHVHHYLPGQTIEIKLSRQGCQPAEESVILDDQTHLRYELPRRAFAEIVLPSNFEQAAERAGVKDLFVFPSRDGSLYAFSPRKNDVEWSRAIGRFGDRLSDLHVRAGMVYVGTVNSQLLALRGSTGTTAWSAKVRGPILAAPASSGDLKWVGVGNAYGEVFVIDNRTGRRWGQFATENEIVTSPIFTVGHLVVGSVDSHVYAYHLESKAVRFILELTGEVRVNPVLHEDDVVLATTDGRLHRIDVRQGKRLWSPRITKGNISSTLTVADRIVVAVSSGHVLSIDPETGSVENRWTLTQSEPGGMRAHHGVLYVGFENGLLSALDLRQGKTAWNWQADAAISAPPLIIDDKLYVACNSGTMQILEIIQ